MIIPVYNVELFLEDALSSAFCLATEFKDKIEFIIVNDGSTDNSDNIVKNMIGKFEMLSIRYIVKENGGLSSARNAGLKIASGKFLYFFDSDDLMGTDFFKKFFQTSDRFDFDVFIFSKRVFNDGESVESGRDDIFKSIFMTPVSGVDFLNATNMNRDFQSSVCQMIINSDFIQKNELAFYSGILHEDELFTPQLLYAAKKIISSEDVLFIRRIRENSIMTSSRAFASCKGYYTVLKEISSKYRRNKEFCKVFNYRFFQIFYEMMKKFFLLNRSEKESFRITELYKTTRGFLNPFVVVVVIAKAYLKVGMINGKQSKKQTL